MADDTGNGDRPHISEKQAQDELNRASAKVSRDDVANVVERQQEIDEKIKAVPPGKFKLLINQIKLLFEMVRDYWAGTYRAVPWESIAMAIGAIVYFLSPVDLIPDVIPVIGYVDDAVVVALAVNAIQSNLREYCAFKGYEPTQYFD